MADKARKRRPSVEFSDDDKALISEALRIARTDLELTVLTVARVWPTSPLIERMNIVREDMQALRNRIES